MLSCCSYFLERCLIVTVTIRHFLGDGEFDEKVYQIKSNKS